MSVQHKHSSEIRDWGWQVKGAGHSLILAITFNPETGGPSNYGMRWLDGLELIHYKKQVSVQDHKSLAYAERLYKGI